MAEAFVEVPLQYVAAIVAAADARRAARLLGYAEAAFSRQYTETYTYEVPKGTLHQHLNDEPLADAPRRVRGAPRRREGVRAAEDLLIAGGANPHRLDHENGGLLWGAWPMDHALRYRVAFVPLETLCTASLDVQEELAFQHQEELVLLVVLVPGKFALEDADPYHRVVHRRQGLVEPGLVRGDFGTHVDEVKLPVLVVFFVDEIIRQK